MRNENEYGDLGSAVSTINVDDVPSQVDSPRFIVEQRRCNSSVRDNISKEEWDAINFLISRPTTKFVHFSI